MTTSTEKQTPSLFDGISREEQQLITACFHPIPAKYQAHETILSYSNRFEKIAFLAKGRAHLYFIDASGGSGVLEVYGDGDVFGGLFFLPVEGLEYVVEADSDCEILLIDYAHVIKRCPKACEHHSLLVSNLFRITAEKAKMLTLRLNILMRKSVRQKLLTYLEYLSTCTDSRTIRVPMSVSALAEYLCADRCAMAREIKRMNEEGLIASSGRNFTLYKKSFF